MIEDAYYNQFVQYIRKKNLSKIYFKQILRGIIEAHGFETITDQFSDDYEEELITDDVIKELTAMTKVTKQEVEKHNEIVRNGICKC